MVPIEGYKVPRVCSEETLKATLEDIANEQHMQFLRKDRTIWETRYRYACQMYELFDALEFRNAWYFYTADAQGPSVKLIGRYKRTPAEWMPVWRDVADRLLKKFKEVKRALKED